MASTDKTLRAYDFSERISNWTVAQLHEFIVAVQRPTPMIGVGVSLKEYMKTVPPWKDDRDVEEIIREIDEGRTTGRQAEG